MRTRAEIEAAFNHYIDDQAKSTNHSTAHILLTSRLAYLQLEVLLDIRDILDERLPSDL